MYPESVCLKNKFAVLKRALITIFCVMMLCSHAGAESSANLTPELVAQGILQETAIKQRDEGQPRVASQGEDLANHAANKKASSEDGALVVSLIEPAYTSLDGAIMRDRPSDATSAGKDVVPRMPYAVEMALLGLLGLVIVARRKWNGPR